MNQTLSNLYTLLRSGSASSSAVVLAGLVGIAAASPANAQVIEAGVNSTPSVLLLLDTSGSMEWLDEEDSYPLCLTSPTEYPIYNVPCASNGNCADGLYCSTQSNRCEFYRSRNHEALEALTGTIQNYYPACDNRDSDPSRIDQQPSSPPQGIRHSIACSYTLGYTLAQSCYRLPTGTLATNSDGQAIPPTGFRQRNDGLLDLYGPLLTFGFMSFDSFRSPTTNAAGMFSYGAQGYSANPGLSPSACANDASCWNLGARRPGNIEGGAIAPVDPADETFARREVINRDVQNALLNVVPYWSTPISSMLEDALTFYAGGDDGYYSYYRSQSPGSTDAGAFDYSRGLTDLYGECRRRSVVLITDGVPSFADCVRRGTITSNDPFPSGCDGYWYKDAEYYAEQLLDEGIETYVIGFNIIDQFDDTDPRSARARLQRIADAGNTGANPVRYADSSRELIFELGDILAQLASASTGRTRPAQYNVLSATDQGQYALNARFNIDRESRYWSGDLAQSALICSGATLTERANDISAAAVLDAVSPSERVILTASPDINSCVRGLTSRTRSLFDSDSFGTGTDTPLANMTTEEIAEACYGPYDPTAVVTGGGGGGPSPPPISQTPSFASCASLLLGDDGYNVQLAESSGRTATCVTELDLTVAGANPGLFNASSSAESKFFFRWLRGETLTEIRLNTVEPDSVDYADVLDSYLPANLKFSSSDNRYLRDRLSSLADIFHSSPAVLGPPVVGPNSSASFQTYAATTVVNNQPRTSMAFVGTNDGLLHAFDARTMEELWAFLPPSFAGRISEWIEPGHTFMLDGTPVVQEMVLDRRVSAAGTVDTTWASVLVVGYRGGGRGYLALDVTNPVRPRFLWELDAAHDPQLGLTFSEPGVGAVRYAAGQCPDGTSDACERGVAILTGGRPPSNASPGTVIGRTVYVVDMETGYVVRRFTEARGASGFADFADPMSGSISVFDGSDGSLVSRAFWGDTEGRLYRLDLSDGDPSKWRVDLFFDPADSARFPAGTNFGEVVFRPTISLAEDRRAVVIYGMGNVDQLDDLGTDSNYVISLTERPVFSGTTVQRYRGFINWAAELEQYEKMTARPRIFDGRAYFATFLPNSDNLCDIGGARLYALRYDGNRTFIRDANAFGTEGPVGAATGFGDDFFVLPESSNVGSDGSLSTSSDLVAYWDENSGSFIPERTILYSIDFTQPPVCVAIDPDDPAFSQSSITSPTATGSQQDIQLTVNMSSFDTDAPGGPAAVATQQSFDIPIDQFARAYATSWTLILE
jgi:type IV pilus assembly protein PilY1